MNAEPTVYAVKKGNDNDGDAVQDGGHEFINFSRKGAKTLN
jgi:hypothetical protein